MKRTLVISDIHGCYKELMQLLEEAAYIPEQDRLIILGDMIDRGKDSREVVTHIMELKKDYDVEVIGGNHEQLLGQWLNDSFDRGHVYGQNGGWKTIESYCKPHGVYGKVPKTKEVFRKYYQDHISFLTQLPNYYEDERFIYVHAGIDLTLADWHDTTDNFFRWSREEFWEGENKTGKTVIFGHTPTCFLHEAEGVKSYEIWRSKDGKIAIDGGCSMGGKLHALCIEEDAISVFSVDKIQ